MKNILLFVILLITVYSQAQNDFRKGYIVKSNNEVIHGLIDYRSNKENAKHCYFKLNESTKAVMFTPVDINSFQFENSKKFISGRLVTGNQSDMVFFEYMINGVVDLYYFRSNDSEEIFYLSSFKEGFDYLQNSSVKVKAGGVEYEHENKEYITTICRFFENNRQMIPKLGNLTFTQKSILNIVKEYNRLVYPDSICTIYHNFSSTPTFTWGPVIGSSIQFLKADEFMINQESWLKNCDFSTVFSPQVGIFGRLSLPELNERYCLQYDLVYNQIQTESHHQYSINGNQMNIDAMIKRQGLDNCFQLFYLFPTAGFRPQLHTGIYGNWFFNTQYYVFKKQSNYLGEIIYSYENTENPFQNIDMGIVMGLGNSFTCLNQQLLIDLTYRHNFLYNKNGTKLQNLVMNGLSIKVYWLLGK